MRKFILLAVSFVMTVNLMAQRPAEGSFVVRPMVGLGMSFFGHEMSVAGITIDSKLKAGFTIGAEAGYQVNSWFQPSVGVFYSQQGSKIESDVFGQTYTSKAKLDYINIPVLANFYVWEGLALKIGVQPGFNINSKLDGQVSLTQYNDVDAKDITESFQLQIPIGASYEYSNFVFDVRMLIPCTKAYKNQPDDSFFESNHNDVYQVTVGYNFTL